MTARRSALVIATMALVIAALCVALMHFARDELGLAAEAEEEEIPARSALTSDEGLVAVQVAKKSQQAGGIAMRALQAATARDAAQVYGVVLDLQPLFELRGRYLGAMAEVRGRKAELVNSTAEHQRAKKLFADDRNVSERALLAAESQWRSDQARLSAAEQSASALLDSLRARYGAAVAGWAANPQSSAFEALARQRQALVQLVFPGDLQAHAGRASVAVASLDSPQERPGRFVSASPQTDFNLPGATYLYAVDGDDLRAGMRVTGRLQLGKPREGVAIPTEAVVWHGGKAWVYINTRDEIFVRREIDSSQEIEGGWFAADGFAAGDQVVVSGAQLLLSEELKYQIRNENED